MIVREVLRAQIVRAIIQVTRRLLRHHHHLSRLLRHFRVGGLPVIFCFGCTASTEHHSLTCSRVFLLVDEAPLLFKNLAWNGLTLRSCSRCSGPLDDTLSRRLLVAKSAPERALTPTAEQIRTGDSDRVQHVRVYVTKARSTHVGGL